MNFEEIEQASINYLKQTSNPLVRITVLHAHVSKKSKEQSLTIQEYMDFLSNHFEIKVMDPLAMIQNKDTVEAFQSAGFTTSPCAILASRVPNSQHLAAAMLDQLQSMTNALSGALQEAHSNGDTAKARQIYETLERTSKIKEKIIAFTKAS